VGFLAAMLEHEPEGDPTNGAALSYHPYRAMAFADEPTPACPEARRALLYAVTAIFCFGFLLGPIALRMGQTARLSIADNPGTTGLPLANAAILLGKIALGLHLALTLVLLGMIFFGIPGPGFACR